jgi:hypothetical protein
VHRLAGEFDERRSLDRRFATAERARGQGIINPAWYKAANYYAGPGTSIRACIEVQIPAGGATPMCGKSASPAREHRQWQ